MSHFQVKGDTGGSTRRASGHRRNAKRVDMRPSEVDDAYGLPSAYLASARQRLTNWSERYGFSLACFARIDFARASNGVASAPRPVSRSRTA